MKRSFPRSSAGSLASPLLAMAASISTVAVILAVLVFFDVHEYVLILLQWTDAQGVWAGLMVIGLLAVIVVFILPGALVTTGAGFVFGVVEGTLYVVLGTTLGATLAFLLARYFFGRRARQFVVSRTRLRLFTEELTPQGWKIVLLSRLIPFFPSKLSNYFFGLTPFHLRGFVLGSLVGFIPFSLHNVYLGAIVADLTQLGQREAPRTTLEWAIYATGFGATVISIIVLSRISQRAMARYEEAS